MTKKIVLIHGRASKPSKTDLAALWLEALHHGLIRDHGHHYSTLLDQASIDMAYYGDLSAQLLSEPTEHIDSRIQTLQDLKQFDATEFTRHHYLRLPGRTTYKDELVSVAASIGSLFGIADNIVGYAAPDIAEYWNSDSDYSNELSARVADVLASSITGENTELLIVAHSLGAIVAFDCLHKMASKLVKPVTFLSLGSPLGSNIVQDKLHHTGVNDVPMIRHWHNIAARDDYICYDQGVSNDFAHLTENGVVKQITDYTDIYNLSVRDGVSNPHSSLGYLVHPATSGIVAHWLSSDLGSQ